MKKTLFLLSLLLTSSIIFGQVNITNDDDSGAIVNGDTITIASYDITKEVHLNVINLSGSSINYKWRRTIINSNFTTLTDQ